MTRFAFALIVSLLLLAAPAPTLGHGGGLDSYGGHHNRKLGGYHFHRGPLAGRSYSSKTAALEALRKHREGSSKPGKKPDDPAAVIKKASTSKRIDSLIALLVRKRLITEAELAAEIKRK